MRSENVKLWLWHEVVSSLCKHCGWSCGCVNVESREFAGFLDKAPSNYHHLFSSFSFSLRFWEPLLHYAQNDRSMLKDLSRYLQRKVATCTLLSYHVDHRHHFIMNDAMIMQPSGMQYFVHSLHLLYFAVCYRFHFTLWHNWLLAVIFKLLACPL